MNNPKFFDSFLAWFLAALVAAFAVLGVASRRAIAQCEPAWQPLAAPQPTDAPISGMVYWDPDGEGPLSKVLILCHTPPTPATNHKRVVAFHPETGMWEPMSEGLTGSLFDPTVTSNNQLVGYMGISPEQGSVVRWNGTSWEQISGIVQGRVSGILTVPGQNGFVIFGGFSSIGPAPLRIIARWEETVGWTQIPTTNYDSAVMLVADVDPSGRIIAASPDGESLPSFGRRPFFRFNGTSWDQLSPEIYGFNEHPTIESMFVDSSGVLYYSGCFYTPSVLGAIYMARWSEAEGISALNGGSNCFPVPFAELSSGDVVFAAESEPIRTTASPFLYPPDQTLELERASVNLQYAYRGLGDVSVIDDGTGRLFVAGSTPSAPAYGSFIENGTLTTAGGSTLTERALKLFQQQDGTLRAELQPYSNTWPKHSAVLTPNGWRPLANPVRRSDGTIIPDRPIEFVFRGPGGEDHALIRAEDNTPAALYSLEEGIWNSVSPPLPTPANGGYVLTALTLPNSNVIVGGTFRLPWFPLPRYAHIARWDGSSWHEMGAGFNDSVYALTLAPNGDLIASGYFSASGTTQLPSRIARWDGTTWQPMGSGSLSGDFVSALQFDETGHLVAGGQFVAIGGVNANRIARWDGAMWSAMGTGLTSIVGTDLPVRDIVSLPNGDIVVGGSFTTAGGEPANRVARWDGSVWNALGTGLECGVSDLMISNTGDLLAAGCFLSASGLSSPSVARFGLPPGCGTCDPIDFNNNSLFPEDQDLIDFLSVLAGGACSTGTCNDIDFNNDGLFPDDADLVSFLNVLAGGPC